MKTIPALACLLTLVAWNTMPNEGEFKLVKQDKVLSLYERWIPGPGEDQIREVKAVFEVKADMEAAISLLTDQAKGQEWNANAKQYRVIINGARSNWITYTRYNIPWPFGDQDCCLSHQVYKTSGSLRSGTIQFESIAHTQFPVTSAVTRIQGTRGRWYFEELPGDRMRVSYTISTNRSKKVPRWVTDPIVRNSLFSSMTSFRTMLQQ